MGGGLHGFVDRTQFSFSRERLQGYPVKVPGNLLVTNVLMDPDSADVDLMIAYFGNTSIQMALSHLVEKGKVPPHAARQVRERLPQSRLFQSF